MAALAEGARGGGVEGFGEQRSHREEVGALDLVVAPPGSGVVARDRAVAQQHKVGEAPSLSVR